MRTPYPSSLRSDRLNEVTASTRLSPGSLASTRCSPGPRPPACPVGTMTRSIRTGRAPGADTPGLDELTAPDAGEVFTLADLWDSEEAAEEDPP